MKIEFTCATVSKTLGLEEDFWKKPLTMVAKHNAVMIIATVFKELLFLEKLTLEVDSYMPGELYRYMIYIGKVVAGGSTPQKAFAMGSSVATKYRAGRYCILSLISDHSWLWTWRLPNS